MSESLYVALERAWQPARATAALSSVSIAELREQASGYISPNLSLSPTACCVDMGTGIGVPGLLLALICPDTRWCLVDSSENRCEIAAAAVKAVHLEERVEVVHERLDDFAHQAHRRGAFDLVVARLLGTPSEVAECGIPLLAEFGSLVVSVSARTSNIWLEADLAPLASSVVEQWKTRSGRYLRLQRKEGAIDDKLPRRAAARKRAPLFSNS